MRPLPCGSARGLWNPIVTTAPSTSCAALHSWRPKNSEAFQQISRWVPRARGAALRELEELRSDRTDSAENVPVVKTLKWGSPLRIIKYPDPRLRAQNARIGVFDSSLQQLAKELLEVMYNGDDGVGLAAPQVGVNLRLMVFNPTGKRGETEYVLINPKIVSSNKKLDTDLEGCLSFPKIFADVERPTTIKIKAQDMSGAKVNVTLTGWQARIFQHEFDHLQGVLFHDRMKPSALNEIRSKLVSLEDQFAAQNPGVPIQRVAQG